MSVSGPNNNQGGNRNKDGMTESEILLQFSVESQLYLLKKGGLKFMEKAKQLEKMPTIYEKDSREKENVPEMNFQKIEPGALSPSPSSSLTKALELQKQKEREKRERERRGDELRRKYYKRKNIIKS